MQEVKVYTTPSCPYCQRVKSFLEEKNIEYSEIDVAQDAQKRQEVVEKTGQLGIPVTQIGDEFIVGFDPNKISQLLGIQ